MKKILLLILLVIANFTGFSQKLEKMKQIEVDGFYTNPLVSPDGQHVLLTGRHFRGVYILELATKKIIQVTDKEGSGYGYSWDQNSDTVYFRQKEEKEYFNNAKAFSYSISTGRTVAMPELEVNTIASYHGTSKETNSQIVVYTNLATLKIEAKDLATKKSWIITSEEGQYYNALLSPDGSKVAVHKGADIYIYDITGNGKGKKIGTGLATSWSKDGKYLIGFLDESEDGHNVSNSDLYWFDIENGTVKKITRTEVLFEMFPSFVDNQTIIFSEDKSGAIYIANLKM
ncbi:hypothetical protein NHF50_12400 [Flavobacterium sp. NRK F10]|uniref:TolB family protein n=1 Tax=Flavobacterium sp. NRK F10 TaxID=2954931 RepID=UPI002091DEE1|nr:hypothetical protein [Flavobacterium sp. NRK F10]MCO6175844.1 hypothetical protein [Flavobacterium sp. NRK F10]